MIRSALALIAVAAIFTIAAAAPAPAAQPYPVDFHTFSLASPDSSSGTVFSDGALRLDDSAALATTSYTDPFANANGDGVDGSGDYAYGTWTSGIYTPGFAFNELVSSWNAKTPAHTWIQVEVKPQLDDGHWAAKWYVLGRWTYGDSDFHRTSVGGQGNADGFVSIDTFFAKDHPAIAYRLQLTLYRRVGATEGPSVSRLSAVTSNLTNQKPNFPSASTLGPNESLELGVPPFSQELHHGEYPQYDNGGEAWCSPTSTSMVVAYWGAAYTPTDAEMSTIRYADPQVDYTARYVFDYHYDGAGNWPFNAAYGGTWPGRGCDSAARPA
jgi:Peptidase_C39 like family